MVVGSYVEFALALGEIDQAVVLHQTKVRGELIGCLVLEIDRQLLQRVGETVGGILVLVFLLRGKAID